MSVKKPQPLHAGQSRPRCPVCGETSYSAAGVHPQCAAREADTRRMARVKRDRGSAKAEKKTSALQTWQKTCPKCGTRQHIRKKVCVCGQEFAVRVRTSNGEDDLS